MQRYFSAIGKGCTPGEVLDSMVVLTTPKYLQYLTTFKQSLLQQCGFIDKMVRIFLSKEKAFSMYELLMKQICHCLTNGALFTLPDLVEESSEQ
jgi:hypothetical protein